MSVAKLTLWIATDGNGLVGCYTRRPTWCSDCGCIWEPQQSKESDLMFIGLNRSNRSRRWPLQGECRKLEVELLGDERNE